jgi:hypothetical protein
MLICSVDFASTRQVFCSLHVSGVDKQWDGYSEAYDREAENSVEN